VAKDNDERAARGPQVFEPMADEKGPNPAVLVSRINGHRCQAHTDNRSGVQGGRGEEDMPNDRSILNRHKTQVVITGSPEPINNVGLLILFKSESVESANRRLVPRPFSSDWSHGPGLEVLKRTNDVALLLRHRMRADVRKLKEDALGAESDSSNRVLATAQEGTHNADR